MITNELNTGLVNADNCWSVKSEISSLYFSETLFVALIKYDPLENIIDNTNSKDKGTFFILLFFPFIHISFLTTSLKVSLLIIISKLD